MQTMKIGLRKPQTFFRTGHKSRIIFQHLNRYLQPIHQGVA